MGFMDAFKKEANCQKCMVTLPKNRLNGYDSTKRGTRPGERLQVCRDCLMHQLSEDMDSFQGKAVAVPPLPKMGGYHFYAFWEMIEYEYPPAEVDVIRGLLPEDGTSCQCGKPAKIMWCSLELFEGNNPLSGEFRPEKAVKEPVCARCFMKRFEAEVRERDIYFYELYSPSSEPGLWTPMEV
ncbi:MAG: hypothetical protein Q8Q08_06920 [Candidatus Omnitrophota bacterium]|nr:hypothetical protein [Candidatus Omnitrophota bacterium]MDZ4242837.1 hypothetical protein [Candidatus Omnitrophota bacterium]